MFPQSATCAFPVFYKSYSRYIKGARESWKMTCDRTTQALFELGDFADWERQLVRESLDKLHVIPSGRWLWVGGTEWLNKPENYSGAFNCTGTDIIDWHSFGLLMGLAMQGSGTGAVLEPRCINNLPMIRVHIDVEVADNLGQNYPYPEGVGDTTEVHLIKPGFYSMSVGDSRQGWVDAYQWFLEKSSDPDELPSIKVIVDLSFVRQSGSPLKGFGGTANPVKLPNLFKKITKITNAAVGRYLTSLECCLLIDEAALCVVAGNIRRSAGIRQFCADDLIAENAKTSLWQQDSLGNWKIDPDRDALRMANHTRVFHRKPTLDECIGSVRKQYYSGEGAIQWAGEAIARANADILNTSELKQQFLDSYEGNRFYAASTLRAISYRAGVEMDEDELDHRMSRYSLNPCGEICGKDFHCNLSEVHLSQINPLDFESQRKAFRAGALIVCALLKRGFTEERYQRSRDLDPIVAVSFTGWFDFCVNLFGVKYLEWYAAGRGLDWGQYPDEKFIILKPNATFDKYQSVLYKDHLKIFLPPEIYRICSDRFLRLGDEFRQTLGQVFQIIEEIYLSQWKGIVAQMVESYCDYHLLKQPNRFTTVQPAGTKSLLTGSSPGWHPPKDTYYLRRITMPKNDPVALACIDYGYSVVPSQLDKDKHGVLLDDPFDPRCTEWLVEIPTCTNWAHLPGVDQVDISQLPFIAQWRAYMTVQQHWTTFNTSATLEITADEIEEAGRCIHQAIEQDQGYVSAAILARFHDKQTFPRLPFEPITKDQYEVLMAIALSRRKNDDFDYLVNLHTPTDFSQSKEAGDGVVGCDSGACLLP